MLLMMVRAARVTAGIALAALIALAAGNSSAVAQSKLPTVTVMNRADSFTLRAETDGAIAVGNAVG